MTKVAAVSEHWPASWLDHVSLDRGIQVLLGAHLATALLALMFPQRRLVRIAYSFMLLQYMAFINGFGKIDHGFHSWFFVSVLLIFLPDGRWHERKAVSDRHYFLTILWSCQVVVLFFYTLTGFWKVAYGIGDLVGPGISGFQFNGFSLIIAQRLIITSQSTFLGEFFVHNPIVGWALFNGTMYLEMTSLLIAFRPRLYRAWGVGLVLFHVGTQVAMGFTFLENIILVSLLLICAPAAPDSVSLKAAVLDLPGIHFISRRLHRRPKAEPELVPEREPVAAPG